MQLELDEFQVSPSRNTRCSPHNSKLCSMSNHGSNSKSKTIITHLEQDQVGYRNKAGMTSEQLNVCSCKQECTSLNYVIPQEAFQGLTILNRTDVLPRFLYCSQVNSPSKDRSLFRIRSVMFEQQSTLTNRERKQARKEVKIELFNSHFDRHEFI